MAKQRPFDTGIRKRVYLALCMWNFSSSVHLIRLNNPFKVQRVAVWKEQPYVSDSQIR